MGLAQTVAWYTENRDWWQAAKAATEARYAEVGPMTNWLVTGSYGQLGTHALPLLDGEHVVAVDVDTLDITDADAVDAAIAEHRPDVVLNAAAYTAVDAAEENEALAAAVNETGPRNLAEALARHGGRLLHVSTDYVFDGTATARLRAGRRRSTRRARTAAPSWPASSRCGRRCRTAATSCAPPGSTAAPDPTSSTPCCGSSASATPSTS